jgi:hypothetical protein
LLGYTETYSSMADFWLLPPTQKPRSVASLGNPKEVLALPNVRATLRISTNISEK